MFLFIGFVFLISCSLLFLLQSNASFCKLQEASGIIVHKKVFQNKYQTITTRLSQKMNFYKDIKFISNTRFIGKFGYTIYGVPLRVGLSAISPRTSYVGLWAFRCYPSRAAGIKESNYLKILA
jgi:hypothetical protein